MENSLEEWFCPLCSQKLSLTPYPKGGGFRLDCFGSDTLPHRLRIYLDKFRKDASFLPASKVAGAEAPRASNSRVRSLLERAERLAAE